MCLSVCRLDITMGAGDSQSVSRFHMTGEDIVKECGDTSRVKQLNVLVTGATSGIGSETARVLAVAGANVYAMGRSEAKVQEVARAISKELQEKSSTAGSIHGVLCDLNSLASVKQFAEKFIKDKTSLNVLILNAGVFNWKYAQTVDGLEQVIGVNHIGHVYLTQLLLPTLIDNPPSRIVIVSAGLHKGPPLDYQALDYMSSTAANAKKGWSVKGSYQQSKLANLLFARALAVRYKDKQVTAYSLHPGVIDTNLAADIPVAGLFKMFFKKKTVSEGVATTVYCALKPGLENESGRYFDDSTVNDLADKWTAEDINTFWQWTEKVIEERTSQLK